MVKSTQGYLRQVISFLKKHLGRDNENSSFYILIVLMLVIFIFGLNLFLDLAEALQKKQLYAFDKTIQEWIIAYRDPSYTPLIAFITDLGDRWAYFAVIGTGCLFLLIKRRWWLTGQILFVAGISAWATVLLKNNYQRQRPTIEHLVDIGGLSFPSGHSLSAMAFYGFVIYLLFRFVKSRWIKISLSIICVLLILSIGLSRIYLGVHFPSDVAAGFVGGLIWASFCIILFNVIELWRKRRKRKQMQGAKVHSEGE